MGDSKSWVALDIPRRDVETVGERAVQTSAFATRSDTNYTWEYSFTTRRLDAETGCMYYRNRYYHPTLGRFQKRDPIGYEGGMNLFNRSMILSAVDPYGLSDWVWPWDPDAEWVWPWDPNASWDLQDTFDTWFYGICQMLDEFANNLPNLNDLITCGCFIFAIADSVLTPIANPVVEYTDCGCNAISAVQTGCSQGVYNGLGYLATTFSDCFSLAVGGSVGGAIGGVFGGKPGAATGAVIGDIANEIAMFGLQNYLSQGTVLPADQIQACCRLLAGGAGAIAEVLQSIVDLVMEFLHEINRIVDDIEHGKLPPLF